MFWIVLRNAILAGDCHRTVARRLAHLDVNHVSHWTVKSTDIRRRFAISQV